MIIVHHLENSRSQRILWLLEELGVKYEVKRYERDKVSNLAPPELKAVHPLGKSPVISDGEIVVAETGAIIQYLMQHYSNGKLQPADNDEARRAYTYWLHYAEGTVMPFMVMSQIFSRIENAKMPFFIKPIARSITGKVRASYLGPNIATNFKFMSDSLGDSPWFLGEEISAIDTHMSFIIEAAVQRTDIAKQYSNLVAFRNRCQARPAYKRALVRGGPYQYA